MEPGVTVLSLIRWSGVKPDAKWGALVAYDAEGDVVWYYKGAEFLDEARLLPNGHLLTLYSDEGQMLEMDMLGTIVRRWHTTGIPKEDVPSTSIAVDADTFHHDVCLHAFRQPARALERGAALRRLSEQRDRSARAAPRRQRRGRRAARAHARRQGGRTPSVPRCARSVHPRLRLARAPDSGPRSTSSTQTIRLTTGPMPTRSTARATTGCWSRSTT